MADDTELTDALQQPLTAACNFIGAARMLLSSDSAESRRAAIDKLDKAENQILRAGDIARGLRQQPRR